MTLPVTIIAPEGHGRVDVMRLFPETGRQDLLVTLPPGQTYIDHVWPGAELLIRMSGTGTTAAPPP